MSDFIRPGAVVFDFVYAEAVWKRKEREAFEELIARGYYRYPPLSSDPWMGCVFFDE